jgi:hypothetical protein
VIDLRVSHGGQPVGFLREAGPTTKHARSFALAPGFLYLRVYVTNAGDHWSPVPLGEHPAIPSEALPALSADGQTVALPGPAGGVMFAPAGDIVGDLMTGDRDVARRLADGGFAPMPIVPEPRQSAKLEGVDFALASGAIVATVGGKPAGRAEVSDLDHVRLVAVGGGQAYVSVGDQWIVFPIKPGASQPASAPSCPADWGKGGVFDPRPLAGPFAKLAGDCAEDPTGAVSLGAPAPPLRPARVAHTKTGLRLVVETERGLYVSPPIAAGDDDRALEVAKHGEGGLVARVSISVGREVSNCWIMQTRVEHAIVAGVGPSGAPSATAPIPLGEDRVSQQRDKCAQGGKEPDKTEHLGGQKMSLPADGSVVLTDDKPYVGDASDLATSPGTHRVTFP